MQDFLLDNSDEELNSLYEELENLDKTDLKEPVDISKEFSDDEELNSLYKELENLDKEQIPSNQSNNQQMKYDLSGAKTWEDAERIVEETDKRIAEEQAALEREKTARIEGTYGNISVLGMQTPFAEVPTVKPATPSLPDVIEGATNTVISSAIKADNNFKNQMETYKMYLEATAGIPEGETVDLEETALPGNSIKRLAAWWDISRSENVQDRADKLKYHYPELEVKTAKGLYEKDSDIILYKNPGDKVWHIEEQTFIDDVAGAIPQDLASTLASIKVASKNLVTRMGAVGLAMTGADLVSQAIDEKRGFLQEGIDYGSSAYKGAAVGIGGETLESTVRLAKNWKGSSWVQKFQIFSGSTDQVKKNMEATAELHSLNKWLKEKTGTTLTQGQLEQTGIVAQQEGQLKAVSKDFAESLNKPLEALQNYIKQLRGNTERMKTELFTNSGALYNQYHNNILRGFIDPNLPEDTVLGKEFREAFNNWDNISKQSYNRAYKTAKERMENETVLVDLSPLKSKAAELKSQARLDVKLKPPADEVKTITTEKIDLKTDTLKEKTVEEQTISGVSGKTTESLKQISKVNKETGKLENVEEVIKQISDPLVPTESVAEFKVLANTELNKVIDLLGEINDQYPANEAYKILTAMKARANDIDERALLNKDSTVHSFASRTAQAIREFMDNPKFTGELTEEGIKGLKNYRIANKRFARATFVKEIDFIKRKILSNDPIDNIEIVNEVVKGKYPQFLLPDPETGDSIISMLYGKNKQGLNNFYQGVQQELFNKVNSVEGLRNHPNYKVFSEVFGKDKMQQIENAVIQRSTLDNSVIAQFAKGNTNIEPIEAGRKLLKAGISGEDKTFRELVDLSAQTDNESLRAALQTSVIDEIVQTINQKNPQKVSQQIDKILNVRKDVEGDVMKKLFGDEGFNDLKMMSDIFTRFKSQKDAGTSLMTAQIAADLMNISKIITKPSKVFGEVARLAFLKNLASTGKYEAIINRVYVGSLDGLNLTPHFYNIPLSSITSIAEKYDRDNSSIAELKDKEDYDDLNLTNQVEVREYLNTLYEYNKNSSNNIFKEKAKNIQSLEAEKVRAIEEKSEIGKEVLTKQVKNFTAKDLEKFGKSKVTEAQINVLRNKIKNPKTEQNAINRVKLIYSDKTLNDTEKLNKINEIINQFSN